MQRGTISKLSLRSQQSAPTIKMVERSSTKVIHHFEPLLNLQENQISEVGKSIPIPHFPASILLDLATNITEVFQIQWPIVTIPANTYVISNLHGDLQTLLSIFSRYGRPPATNYLLLGNFIGLGQYSTETLSLILALLLTYPSNFFVVRGPHECYTININDGFQEEIIIAYRSPTLWEQFQASFYYMPLAAQLPDIAFLSYAGVPNLTIQEISQIPISFVSNSQFTNSFIWGNQEATTESLSSLPEEESIFNFLENNNLVDYICGTGTQEKWIGEFCEGHGFSSSVRSQDGSGIINLGSEGEIEFIRILLPEPTPRSTANFYQIARFRLHGQIGQQSSSSSIEMENNQTNLNNQNFANDPTIPTDNSESIQHVSEVIELDAFPKGKCSPSSISNASTPKRKISFAGDLDKTPPKPPGKGKISASYSLLRMPHLQTGNRNGNTAEDAIFGIISRKKSQFKK